VCEPGSSVSIVSSYRLDDRGSIPGRGERIFPVASVFRPALGPTQPCTVGTGGPLPGNKGRPRCDAGHSPNLVPRSRMSRSCTPLPTSTFMSCSGTALAHIMCVSLFMHRPVDCVWCTSIELLTQS
jgi:hypothetical protein